VGRYSALRSRALPASASRASTCVSNSSTAGAASVRPPRPRRGRVDRRQELALRSCHSHPAGRVSRGRNTAAQAPPPSRCLPAGACARRNNLPARPPWYTVRATLDLRGVA
jgi:hypothetical protein